MPYKSVRLAIVCRRDWELLILLRACAHCEKAPEKIDAGVKLRNEGHEFLNALSIRLLVFVAILFLSRLEDSSQQWA